MLKALELIDRVVLAFDLGCIMGIMVMIIVYEWSVWIGAFCFLGIVALSLIFYIYLAVQKHNKEKGDLVD